MLTEKERAFWQHVIDKTPPPPISADDAAEQWPQDAGTSVVCDPPTVLAVADYTLAKAKIKAAELDADVARAKICAFMGTHSTLIGPSGKPAITWKTAKGSAKYDTARMVEENPDLAARYAFIAPGSRRLLIK
jgi:predicted phage-related endonuclease